MVHLNNQVRLRRSTSAESQRLEVLFADAFRRQPGPYSQRQVEAALAAGLGRAGALHAAGRGVVAEKSGSLVGAAAWTCDDQAIPGVSRRRPSAAHPRLATLRAVFVSPDCARQGVGRRLIEAVMAEASKAGACEFGLYATAGAVAFYETAGFLALDAFDVALGDGLVLPVVEMRRAASNGLAAE
ncbi:MAG: GNAT family N-acetyltransferase [Parvularculaceae bacterium]|nr:GNAT family N-acetyltransferase [Parvularculaceae bacterium]